MAVRGRFRRQRESVKLTSEEVQRVLDALRFDENPGTDPIVESCTPLLTPEERAALEPPRPMTVSQWADEYRVLNARSGSAEPGRWRTDRTPYLREPMDSMGSSDLEMVVIVKPSQVGGSEAIRNAIGYWADQDPGPALLVYPTEKATNEQMTERVGPMFTETPQLSKYVSGKQSEITKDHLDILTMPIYAGWAGSPQALATRPCRFVILDEVDKFPPFAGRESEPVALSMARTRTFGYRKKIVLISTPTTDRGLIWTYYESCLDKRHYHVPCPRCGVLQPLEWSQIRWNGWPEKKQAEVIEAEGVWYECAECKGRIEEHERDEIVEKGKWVRDPVPPDLEGLVSRRRGYHFSALVATIGTRWRDLAAKWMRVQGDSAKLMEFVNQELGEPFREQVQHVSSKKLEKIADLNVQRSVIPNWASCILMTVDTQRGYFKWLVRAWGRRERSQLVDWGEAERFEDLERLLDRKWPVALTGESMVPAITLIDARGAVAAAMDYTRNMTDEVYRWCARFPGRALPAMGMSYKSYGKSGKDVWVSKHTYKRQGFSGYEVRVVKFVGDRLKDLLSSRVNAELAEGEIPFWGLCEGLDHDYFLQMDAEHKIHVRQGQAYVEKWEKRSVGRRNEALDLEVMQIAASKLVGAELAPDDVELERERSEAKKQREDYARIMENAETSGSVMFRNRFTRPDGRTHIHNRGR